MRLLVFAGLYEGKGTGHLMRMNYLANYMSTATNWQIDFESSDPQKAGLILKDLGSPLLMSTELQNNYAAILVDSPLPERDRFDHFRTLTDLLVAFDQTTLNNQIDVLINLFNHNSSELEDFDGKLYHGLSFAVLKESILNAHDEPSKANGNCLITFGGEDPNSNSLKAIKSISGKDLDTRVIIGALNKDKDEITGYASDKIRIIGPTREIGKEMAHANIIICGGGTTLLEAICIGKPIIVMPQNHLEVTFIDHIRSFIRLYDIDEMDDLIANCYLNQFKHEIRTTYQELVDGNGRERILQLLRSELC